MERKIMKNKIELDKKLKKQESRINKLIMNFLKRVGLEKLFDLLKQAKQYLEENNLIDAEDKISSIEKLLDEYENKQINKNEYKSYSSHSNPTSYNRR